MAEIVVFATVTCSAYTIVEADSKAEALAIANGRSAVIGGNGSGADPSDSFVIEDADGEAENLHIEND